MAAAQDGVRVRVRAARQEDVALLLTLIGELAEYERLSHELVATEDQLARALFGEHPAAEALIAEVDGSPAGYALFFVTFSSFLAIQGIWLEDLFVRPEHRRSGAGKALLAAVAARTRERGGERLEWVALDWNELALGFYSSLGAERHEEWITHALPGDALRALAAAAPAIEGPPRL
jgi:GNAT superfamily N-acetyltransferase